MLRVTHVMHYAIKMRTSQYSLIVASSQQKSTSRSGCYFARAGKNSKRAMGCQTKWLFRINILKGYVFGAATVVNSCLAEPVTIRRTLLYAL